MKHKSKRLWSILLGLLLALGLMPGMSSMALAWDGDPYAALLNTKTAVNFDGKEWYLIENNSTAANAGTVTLLSKECVGASAYNNSDGENSKYVDYASSTVKGAVDDYYNNSITADAKKAVADDKMFLLTQEQASSLSTDVLKCSIASEAASIHWFLGSPGLEDKHAATVNGSDGSLFNRAYVWSPLGVRPALKLDLSKVTFDSESNTFSVTGGNVDVTGVSLDPSTAQTIEVNGTVPFTATVEPDNATDKTVNWSVGGTDTGAVKLYSDEACTTEVGTDATENLTVYAKGISAGSATVTCTSDADSTKSASCDVTVNAAVASVTQGGTTTEYADFATALSNWADNSTLTLLADVTTESTISVSGTKTLDLNGHGIKMTGADSVISVPSGANLTLTDSNPTAEHKYTISDPKANGAGLAVVDDTNGSQTFSGGYITGGAANGGAANDRGGGVFISRGTFTMQGGTLIGNTANNNQGGGAAVYPDGTFEMKGGAIIGNTGGHAGGFSLVGGTATISGGTIQYNYATRNGGAINTDYSPTLTISGGSITHNYANREGNSGISIGNQVNFLLSGDVNISDNMGGGNTTSNIYVSNKIKVIGELTNQTPIGVTMGSPGVFTSTSSTDTALNDANKFVSDNPNYAVFKNAAGQLYLDTPVASVTTNAGETTNYVTLPEALSAWTDGSTLTLLADVTTESTISVSGTKTLDLNGHGITMTGNGSVISVPSGAELTISDSSPDAEHKFSVANPAANGAGLAVVDDNGTQSFTGGYITGGHSAGGTGNYDNTDGGGLHVEGTVTMSGGTIIGNYSEHYGGGVAVFENGAFVFEGGSISYNEAAASSGGVHVSDNGSVNITGSDCKVTGNLSHDGGTISAYGSGTIQMSEGEVSGNCCEETARRNHVAGGVSVNNGSKNAKLILSGGVIEGNVCIPKTDVNTVKSGGIYCNSQLKLSGSPTIQDNVIKTGDTETNSGLYAHGAVVSITGELSNATPIGVTMQTPGVFTNSADTSLNDASKFTSDNPDYAVGKNADGQLLLGTPVNVTFDANGHGTSPDEQTVAVGSVVTKPADLSAAGYTFGDWYKEEACENKWDFAIDTVSAPTTLYAKWSKAPATAPTVEGAADLALTYGYSSGSVSVTATAATDAEYGLSYQWYSNAERSNADGTAIGGATGASYAIPAGKVAGTTEYYYCEVTAKREDNGEKAQATSEVATVTVAKADSRVAKAPTPTNPTYDGKAQALVAAGTAEGGEMQYSLDNKEFSAAIPTGTDVGTYHVWYKAVGDANHADSEPACVDATIADKPAPTSAPTLSCLAHLQGKGDVTASSGADSVVGTTGQSRRLEGMSLELPDGTEGSVRYMVHTKDEGWSQGWVADGAFAGTRGESRRAEAIRVELAGGLEENYDVWYRVHAQGYGWMGWACNGAGAGTTGQSRRIEAYEVVVLPKGSDAPGSTDRPFEGLTGDEGEAPTLSCLAHLANKGDVTATSGAGTVVGTTHQSRRLEGMSLTLPEGTEGSVRYMVHTKDEGWSQGWAADGAFAGTRGESRRAEAIRVELDGEVADHYDVWYRVHAQGYGWMGWANNGQGAGTTGQSRRIEAYEVVLLPEGCPAPGATANAFRGSL